MPRSNWSFWRCSLNENHLYRRDGCVNVRLVGDWVMNWDQFEFMPGAIQGIAKLKKAGYRLILITNQRCINLGKFSIDGFIRFHGKMQ